ncbi:putative inactive protein kinase-like [Capsicum annuum]|uniref:Uncharacterized protein n=1 Tax=Capsicum annuum TaxID=4072 RepID=A0A2G2Y8P6_CAPAN|nr:putative inactive protein kinase-like [Capsicum annuum]KAF3629567.1 putative inactive protein kinase-like [Capsicum annuum]PHT66118.1 hypothetical protein T459_30543 [Capsicum annuum]
MRRQQVEFMMKSLKNEAQDGLVVDLSTKILSLNANMTCLMVFGKKYMDQDLDGGIQSSSYKVEHLAATPNLGDFFPFLGVIDLEGLTRCLKDLSKEFDEFHEKIIDEHVQSHEQKQSKVSMNMSNLMNRSNPKTLFSPRIDTSATAIDWILTELLRHPHVMKKLQKELEEVVGLERMVKESELEKLKYLDIVVRMA